MNMSPIADTFLADSTNCTLTMRNGQLSVAVIVGTRRKLRIVKSFLLHIHFFSYQQLEIGLSLKSCLIFLRFLGSKLPSRCLGLKEVAEKIWITEENLINMKKSHIAFELVVWVEMLSVNSCLIFVASEYRLLIN